MPRLAPSLFRRAQAFSPLARILLPACRNVETALAELRWIREHVANKPSSKSSEHRVRTLCQLRGRGLPLPYVLGDQPFGNLEILCRPKVFIPRPEPEAYTTHLSELLENGLLSQPRASGPLRILDLCTGSGCIALLLYSYLHRTFPHLRVQGIDISHHAISLARRSVSHNVAKGLMPAPSNTSRLSLTKADMFAPDFCSRLTTSPTTQTSDAEAHWDVITCNPPYISARGFAHDTARSVRNHEPKLAQVPLARPGLSQACAAEEDVFYARLLDVAGALRARVVLCEVGDLEQARRVVDKAMGHSFSRDAEIQIWADWPDARRDAEESPSSVEVSGRTFTLKGSGSARSVFICTK